MLIAAAISRRRRLYFPVAESAALENFDSMRRYSLRQRASQPTWLSLLQQVAHDVPVKDSVSSSLSWRCSLKIRSRLTQRLGRLIFSQLSTLLPTLPAAVCALV
jgi:hypothetical protein